MKTFAETRNKKPFDWNSFLEKPIESISVEEMENADLDAADWVTCACGNQCDVLPRRRDGSPQDIDLYKMGVEFAKSVYGMYGAHSWYSVSRFYEHRDHAKQILNDIEKRSAELLSQIQTT